MEVNVLWLNTINCKLRIYWPSCEQETSYLRIINTKMSIQFCKPVLEFYTSLWTALFLLIIIYVCSRWSSNGWIILQRISWSTLRCISTACTICSACSESYTYTSTSSTPSRTRSSTRCYCPQCTSSITFNIQLC